LLASGFGLGSLVGTVIDCMARLVAALTLVVGDSRAESMALPPTFRGGVDGIAISLSLGTGCFRGAVDPIVLLLALFSEETSILGRGSRRYKRSKTESAAATEEEAEATDATEEGVWATAPPFLRLESGEKLNALASVTRVDLAATLLPGDITEAAADAPIGLRSFCLCGERS
jgi:hypothetical protein